ncbi:MAG: hypothetical protein RR343_02260 [Oscillospiraceae bacterium]
MAKSNVIFSEPKSSIIAEPKISSSVASPKQITATPLASNGYTYELPQTNFLVKTGNGAFVDKTAEISQGGYLGRAGESTVIRIQLSGYKYTSSFEYHVTTPGQMDWGSSSWWWAQQDGTFRPGMTKATFDKEFFVDGTKFYANARTDAGGETPDNRLPWSKIHSEYSYLRKLNCYTSPQFEAFKNNTAIPASGGNGDVAKIQSTDLKLAKQAYQGLGYASSDKRAMCYWSFIATSYEQLNTHTHNIPIKEMISQFAAGTSPVESKPGEIGADATTIAQTDQWDTADAIVYDALSFSKFTLGDIYKYNVYYDIDLSKMTDASKEYGEYSISIDNGAVKSVPLKLSLYEAPSPLTMQQSEPAGTVATSSSVLKIYNASSQPISASIQPASAVLGGNPVNLVNSGYFTPANAASFGSAKAMSNIEVCLDNKNINAVQTLSPIPAGSNAAIPISLKNANAISQALSGTITVPITFTFGSSTAIVNLSIPINSVVPQLTVSVPLNIYLYVAKDGSSATSNNNKNYIGNKSAFPVKSMVSAALVQQKAVGSNYPVIDNTSQFKLWIKSTKSANIPFYSVASDVTPNDYKDFGSIAARDGKLYFYISTQGALPVISNPEQYHYKLFFKFSYSSEDCP